jgi:hypothetical protein
VTDKKTLSPEVLPDEEAPDRRPPRDRILARAKAYLGDSRVRNALAGLVVAQGAAYCVVDPIPPGGYYGDDDYPGDDDYVDTGCNSGSDAWSIFDRAEATWETVEDRGVTWRGIRLVLRFDRDSGDDPLISDLRFGEVGAEGATIESAEHRWERFEVLLRPVAEQATVHVPLSCQSGSQAARAFVITVDGSAPDGEPLAVAEE